MRNEVRLATALVLSVAAAANARTMTGIAMDSTISDHRIIYFGKGEDQSTDSAAILIQKFYEDQFLHFP